MVGQSFGHEATFLAASEPRTARQYRIARAYRQERHAGRVVGYRRAIAVEVRCEEDLPAPGQAYTEEEMTHVLGIFYRTWQIRAALPEDEPYAYEVIAQGRGYLPVDGRRVYYADLVSSRVARDLTEVCKRRPRAAAG